ncbi:MAG: hypothetical protein HW386_883 [Gammaproteobacteria bacterium]|nr:hypothetical protein [Gammaproteobacteria bacterium]
MESPNTANTGLILRGLGICLLAYVAGVLFLMFIWDGEPDPFDVTRITQQRLALGPDKKIVTGAITAATFIEVISTVLDKRGGYLSNDIFPPGVFMDNVPAWEYGVITQVRDMVRSFRNDFSRSQTQSTEDQDLSVADPQFHFDTESWILPSTESEYRKGIIEMENFLGRLVIQDDPEAQVYARADNLRDWLAIVEKRLGSLSQRLSASVGQIRVNTDLQGDTAATQSTEKSQEITVKTPWLEIDDVFYEARGSVWALIHFLKAVELDFGQVLEKKNAQVSLRQIIRELEATQDPVWSPMILNGTGFGFVANHSLVMASYLSRANAAVIDLRNLLEQG